jgi:hypothetical protein
MGRFTGRARERAAVASQPPAGRRRGGYLAPGIVVAAAVALLGGALYASRPAAAVGYDSKTAGHRLTAAHPLVPAVTVPGQQGGSGQGGTSASQVALSGQPASGRSGRGAALAGAQRQIIIPDLIIVAPKGLTAGQIASLRKIAGVRNMITFDGAEITAGGRSVSVVGVNPDTFRSWVPLRTASDQAFWTALAAGDFVASSAASQSLALQPGAAYSLVGSTSQIVKFAMSARLGLAGVDLLVNQALSARLGLVRQVAGLISAPGVGIATLTSKVSKVLGPSGRIEVLRSQLPVTAIPSGTVPTTYLQLFKASAAQFCPGLSWTVLAAIGQIESADGTNMGPSSAGALGPMQFLPSTWARWGIDAFGQTGPPDVMNPYDAVPAAARLLCADGAAAGGKSLSNAIFDYNHANWYVNEVLSLAAQYAADYH